MNLHSLKKQRDLVLEIARTHGAYDVRVFGSISRGEETDNSDIDLLVNFEPGRSLFDLIELKDELEELLGIRVDIISENGLNKYMKDTVLGDAIQL
ncbi:nucleotidyltransferase family protein [Ammoniphilus sp. CFH 90114]|uniref:nucleotidyltransferase family protein n=1 Tax=Ammoniphilus sp. CFH 90114 TaxID=2493665 RepID=UPI00100E2156|nr:nucleotidyltransferase domain-containing protein [Ammoniphilus sp. CFH 90114]RXT02750.1 nucleotidyltransferase [Ammoniphilus sp. CFH 90114]